MRSKQIFNWGLFFIFCASLVSAEDIKTSEGVTKGPPIEVKIRLIYGTNKAAEKPDEELAKLVDTLKEDFGYTNYEIRKSEKATLAFDETATRELGDKIIFIIRNLGIFKEKRKVWLELWFRDKKVFGAFSLFPKQPKPLLIKGPNTNDGVYIITVSLVNGEAGKKSE